MLPRATSEPVSASRPSCRGFTLIEVMIGILLVALIVTSIFSLVLTSATAAKKSGRKAKALFFSRQAMERLKAYVTADQSVTGPNGGAWTFPGDASGGYALAPGDHDISSTLPAEFTSGLTNLVFMYTVTDDTSNCGTDFQGSPRQCKKVEFICKWDED